jgi:CubicO group peptidase (beta-lactamase class C family)
MNSRQAVWLLISGALLTTAATLSAFAEGSFDIPAGAHFNQQKLQRIGEFFRGEIAGGKIPGAILLIQQHGRPVYHEFFGVRDVATRLPMTDDTIFRLYSMSKPITSVAATMLIDEGRLKLDDPVAKYIPSFAKAKVGVEKNDDHGEKVLELVPVKRPITILDLMTHTSGTSMTRPKSMTAISTMPNLPNASRGFRSRYSPAPCGTMATRPTFSGASWRSCRENRFCISSRTGCSGRSA